MIPKNSSKKFVRELLSELKAIEAEVIKRRFGLLNEEAQTLERIGMDYGLTRERIRQIEEKAKEKLKKEFSLYPALMKELEKDLEERGPMRETRIIEEGGREGLFLFFLHPKFLREKENQDFYTFWVLKKEGKWVKEKVKKIIEIFREKKAPLSLEEIAEILKIKKKKLIGILEISKAIGKNSEGLFGLKEWPEINPKGLKDLAYLVLKKAQKPLHFTEISSLIENVNTASLHNELLRNDKFVLVGRGIFALKEWGYLPGTVKEIIYQILKEKKKPMTKDEIWEEVKKQRLVKKETVFLALYDKNYFEKDQEGRYRAKILEA